MKKAILLIILTALLLIAGTGATVAWLTASTTPKENVFTIGDISMTLTEPQWDASGADHTIVPGKTLTKDPKVTILANSEKCYVFVKIEVPAELSAVINYTIDSNWTPVKGETNIYYKIVDKEAADTVLPVLAENEIKIADTVTKSQLGAIGANNTMKIFSYAIQYEFVSSKTDPMDRAAEALTIIKAAA